MSPQPRSAAARRAASTRKPKAQKAEAREPMIAADPDAVADAASAVEVELPDAPVERPVIDPDAIEVDHVQETTQASATVESGDRVVVQLRHKRNCPRDPERTESHRTRVPEKQGGHEVAVVRCVDCGVQAVIGDDGHYEDE